MFVGKNNNSTAILKSVNGEVAMEGQSEQVLDCDEPRYTCSCTSDIISDSSPMLAQLTAATSYRNCIGAVVYMLIIIIARPKYLIMTL